jgi:predicted alpha/beta-fold hydrolase
MGLFLYGTLLDDRLFQRVAGPGGEAVRQRAWLDGHGVDRVEGSELPMLVRRPGARAEGALWEGLTAAQQDRLDLYEVAFGYALIAVTVGTEAGERQALAGRGPVGRISSIRAFDAAITAPRWGWSSVEAYYRGASPLRTLLQPGQSGTSPLPPTLVLHAEDDPWVPVAPSRRLVEAQLPGVEVLLSPGGGHNGFHAVDDEPLACWSDRLSVRWLRRLVGASP